jgi:hypothetical protein
MKGLPDVAGHTKAAASLVNADEVTDAGFRRKAPGLDKPDPLHVKSLGVDLVIQDLSSVERLSGSAAPGVPDKLMHGLLLVTRTVLSKPTTENTEEILK